MTTNSTTIQDINRSFKKWTKTTSEDECYRLKTTQILMAMKRGYFIPDYEVKMLTNSPIANEYYQLQNNYFTSPSIDNSVLMMEARTKLLHQYTMQTYHQLLECKNYFIDIMDRMMKHFGYQTIKKAMSASYAAKGEIHPTFRVVFLDIVDKNHSMLGGNITIALTEAKMIGSIKSLTVITPQVLPPNIVSEFSLMRDINIKIISDVHMRFDPGEHAIQPSHRVLQRDDVRRISRETKIAPENLPRMTPRDGLVQFIGLEPGKGIEFNRDNYLNPLGTTYYARVY